MASSRDLQQGAIDRSYANLERLVGLQDNSLGFRKVEKGALEVLISYLEPGSPLYNRINGLSDYGADLVSQAIIDSIRKGYNATETARMIRKAFGAPLSESLRMTRTTTAWSYREANRLQYMTNPQAVEGWIWYSALDPGRTCMSCVNLHGTFHSAAEVQNDHHNGLAELPGNKIISSSPTALNTLNYRGDVIIINTASGKKLAVTPNHPVLTRRGWIAAQFIKIGDDVISYNGLQGTSSFMRPDKKHIPTFVEDISSTFNMLDFRGVPKPTENLNSEIVDGEIDIVSVNRLLWNSLDIASKQKIINDFFVPGSTEHNFFSGFRGFTAPFKRWCNTTLGFLRTLNHFPFFPWRHLLESNNLCLAHAAYFDAGILQHSSNYGSGNIIGMRERQYGNSRFIRRSNSVNFGFSKSDFVTGVGGYFESLNTHSFGFTPEQPLSLEMIRESLFGSVPFSSGILNAFASDIIFDSVVEIGVRTFSGHVYSLQTLEGYYFSNGIISHNCTSIPKVIGFDNLVDEMGADWFNQQPESVQRQMMGHSKYEAWKDGKISIGDMTKTYQDEVYGEMTREASLRELIGGG